MQTKSTGKDKPRGGSTIPGGSGRAQSPNGKPSRSGFTTPETRRRSTSGDAPANIGTDTIPVPNAAETVETPGDAVIPPATGRGFAPLVLWLFIIALGAFVLAVAWQLES